MAALSEHVSSSKSNILCIGANGSGKTGALVSLAKAGYKLRIVDHDNGVEIIKKYLADDPQALARVDVETCTDEYVQSGSGALIPKVPLQGFSRAMKVLTDWPGLGKPSTWGTDTVLVLDTMTMQGRFILNHVLNLNGRLGQQPQLQDWGAAMSLQEQVMAMLFSSAIKCHVIVMAHITYVQAEGEVVAKGLPMALGSKLPPMIGSYFNSTLFFDKEGVGANVRKVIRTKSKGLIECKTPLPHIPDSLPIETGLADYFKALHGPLKV